MMRTLEAPIGALTILALLVAGSCSADVGTPAQESPLAEGDSWSVVEDPVVARGEVAFADAEVQAGVGLAGKLTERDGCVVIEHGGGVTVPIFFKDTEVVANGEGSVGVRISDERVQWIGDPIDTGGVLREPGEFPRGVTQECHDVRHDGVIVLSSLADESVQ